MIQLGEADHIAAAAAAIAVEQVLVGIDQKARFVIGMQRAQSHQSAAADAPGRLPILRLQIVQQRNLLLQLVDGVAIHGVLASSRRIRQTALRSQARMVGVRKSARPWPPVFIQDHRLSSRR